MEMATEAFDARIDLLAGELELALKWDRPSILLAIYASEFVRMEAQQALAERLRAWDVTVTPYTVTGEEDADIPLALARHPDREQTVFFVSGLRWGGGEDGRNTYRALNLRREYFVEHRIRAVFWLTESEAARLPHAAPDFWAFRHRAVEFVEAPKPEQVAPVARELAWADWSDRTLRQDTEAKIALREGLLRDLPESDETLAARAELLYTLGTLYAAKQDYKMALKRFKQALAIFENLSDTKKQSWCYNSIGNVYADLGHYKDAKAAYHRAIDLDHDYGYPWHGLGNVYSAQDHYKEAEKVYNKALEIGGFPDEGARVYISIGNVYYQQGRYEDAETTYRKAIDLDSESAWPYKNLGLVYEKQEKYEQAAKFYKQAIERHKNSEDQALSWRNLGDVYTILSRYDDALAAFQNALDHDPDYAYAYYGMGNVYRVLGRYDDALAAYQNALNRDPDAAIAHSSLAAVLRKSGHDEEAAAHLARARDLMATESEYNQACIEAIAGNVDAALAHLERALAEAPGHSDWAARDPDLESLHGHPRFEALVDGGETGDTAA